MDINRLLHDVKDQYAAKANERGVGLKLNLLVKRPGLRGDVDRLKQVLINLMECDIFLQKLHISSSNGKAYLGV